MKGVHWKRLCGALGVAALVVAGAASPVSAHRGPVVSAPIVGGLAGPLQFEVQHNGKILVAQSFSGTVTSVDRNGVATDLFNDPGVDGVSMGAWGSVIYTHTDFETGVIELRLRTKKGEVKPLANTILHETENNPDGGQTYGFIGLDPSCVVPPEAGVAPYTGIIDSHPYAVTPTWGGWYVADAGGNDILFVDWHGNVKTVAVLPPQDPIPVTAELAAANELPPCVAGSSFVAEPVPTDVEIGRGGKLYVSTLPGGPEDPSLGARGSVYKVNPWNGHVSLVATGFLGATNLAISPWGTIYVSELFGDQVSKIVHGAPVPVVSLPTPSGLEWSRGKLYVGINTFGDPEAPPNGQIVTVTL
jgi:hypothetical protein